MAVVFKSQLIRKEEVAEGTMAFYLQKPADLTFVAGQHPTFRIVNPPEMDQEGNARTFSFITIPSDTEVGFATRMRDTAFKKTLKNASVGLEIDIENPRGSMVLPTDTKRPLVLLAGGIGITPLISIIREATHQKSDQKIFLFYANRTLSQTAFFKELQQLAIQNLNLTFVPTLTQEESTDWKGEIGRITSEMIKKYVLNTENTLFYLAGASAMVKGMSDVLTSIGIDPIFIKSEDYGEYK